MKVEDVAVQMIMPAGVGAGLVAGVAPLAEGSGPRGAGGGVECGRRLLAAARAGDTDTVRQLMLLGAPFTTDWLGTTPLHVAAEGGHEEALRALLRGGVCRDSRTKVDRTPLHLAATNGHHSCVAALIEAGAKVDALDLLRMTPLHWAVDRGHLHSAQLLLNAGADPHAESKFLKTPLSLARGGRGGRGRPALLRALQGAIAQRALAHTHTHTQEAAENTTVTSSDPKTYSIQQITEVPVVVADGPPSPGAADTGAGAVDTGAGAVDTGAGAGGNASSVHVESSSEVDGIEVDAGGEESEADEGQRAGEMRGGAQTQRETQPQREGAAALLRRHGITLLPADDGGTLLSALSSGRSIVLSDAGKLMLKESSANDVTPAPAPAMPGGGGGGGAEVLVLASPAPAPAPAPAPLGKVFTLAPGAGAKLGKPRAANGQQQDVQEVKLIQQVSDSEKKCQPATKQGGQSATQGAQGGQGGQGSRPSVRIIMNKHNFRKLIATATRASANDKGLLTEEDLELDSESEESGGEGERARGANRDEGNAGNKDESVVTVPEQFVRSGSAQYLRSQLLCAHAAMHHLAHRLRRAQRKLQRLQTHARRACTQ